MKRLTPQQIREINTKVPHGQGIFFEPQNFPLHLRGQDLLYTSWRSGGYQGGNCWDDTVPSYYSRDKPKDAWNVIDETLKILKPDISYLEFKNIEKLIERHNYTDYQYYGNSDDYEYEYIPLQKLYKHFGI